jgi:outer membrane protein OmpU
MFATTALALTSGMAAAEIKMSGSAQMGLIYTETAAAGDDEIRAQHEVDLGIAMSGTTDAGLGFGANFNIAGDGGSNEDSVAYITGAFGKLSIGNDVAEADVQGGIDDVGYDGLGVDDSAESLDGGSTSAHNVNWTYTMSGVTLAASTDLATTAGSPFAIGAKYAVNGLTVGVGYMDSDAAATGDVTSAYVAYTGGPLTVKAMASRRNVAAAGGDVLATGASLAYKVSDTMTVTVAGSDTDATGDQADIGLGMSMSLGGGATFQAGASQVNDLSRASAGLTFSF